ncbi:rho-related GTP-binding protein RhoG-like isoform X5 [Betta splendens]|nr:rho-related GTP-binding protein RhoG-like isoform X5 [Betta splendens]
MQSVKCVAVGDTDIGKTSMIFTYIKKIYPKEYIPGFYDYYSTQVSVDNHKVDLEIRDTSGCEDFDTVRPLCYNGVGVFIICFSIASPASYGNVKNKWLPEIKHHCPNMPFLLVGTKADLRNDQIDLKKQNHITVSQQQGNILAQQIKAVKYVECAAKTQDGLDEVFDEAVRAFLKHLAINKKTCSLL